eukprot:c35001_g1_i1 orf=312-1181(-)
MAPGVSLAFVHGFLSSYHQDVPGSSVSPPRPHLSRPRFVSSFHGSQIFAALSLEVQNRHVFVIGKSYAATTVETPIKDYTLPSWSAFELGSYPVFWETTTGKPPASGESLSIYFNVAASNLEPHPEFGIAFNGGFNQPIMCGGQPRVMTRRDRGINCTPFYIIKINVPVHALTLEFSFTDGKNWDGPYKLKLEVPAKWRNMPVKFFNEGLAAELSCEGACEIAIYPDAGFVQDRCVFPAALIHQGGDRCELDIVPGCTDPESPFFDPLANMDDGSCPTVLGESSDDESD